eukprot:TRINITY_DN51324_c0_g1_i1.p2 TRINITY_DN51324_c0_g1~~TRINITY_DN51324_c0_g1_i1.p2  ORF type:complete len:122 (+),score=9.40 TRINITY_DN51324_c0_g1_i1:2-367(+)
MASTYHQPGPEAEILAGHPQRDLLWDLHRTKWHSTVNASWSRASSMSHAPPRSHTKAPAPEKFPTQPAARAPHRPLARLSQSNSQELQSIIQELSENVKRILPTYTFAAHCMCCHSFTAAS